MMKKIILVLLLALLGVGAMAQKANKERVVLVVEMDCESCKAKIEKSIPFEKGVKDVEVDFKAGEVAVTFDPKKTDKQSIIKAVRKLKMEVKEKSAAL